VPRRAKAAIKNRGVVAEKKCRRSRNDHWVCAGGSKNGPALCTDQIEGVITVSKNFWRKYGDKVGVVGSIFAALCCLGFPALLSILSAIGLGFLINDAVLLPLLVIFLFVTLSGLYLGVRHHGLWLAFVVGLISAAGVFIFIFIAYNKVLAGIGIAGLIAASVINVWLRARKAQS
jgi:mercuric ion transport protein